MTHRRGKPLSNGCGRLVSFAVQLSDIARHFHTGEELGVTQLATSDKATFVIERQPEAKCALRQGILSDPGGQHRENPRLRPGRE